MWDLTWPQGRFINDQNFKNLLLKNRLSLSLKIHNFFFYKIREFFLVLFYNVHNEIRKMIKAKWKLCLLKCILQFGGVIFGYCTWFRVFLFYWNIFEKILVRNFCMNPIYTIKTLKELSFCHKLEFLIPTSLQPDGVNLWYFKLVWLDLTEIIVWNIY